jgi:hypothetical protein
MDCRHLEEVYELFLLGTLPEENSQDLLEHLRRGCERCVARVKEAAQTAYSLSLAGKPVTPSPKVKIEILRSLSKK